MLLWSFSLEISASHNHRRVKFGRDTCRWSISAHLLKARSSREGWSAVLSWILSITKHGGSRTAAGSTFQCSTTFINRHFKLKWNFLYFSLYPFPLVLSWDTTERNLALSSFLSFYLMHTVKIPLNLLAWVWTVLTLSAFPCITDAPRPKSSLWSLTGLTAVCPCLSWARKPWTGASTPEVSQ